VILIFIIQVVKCVTFTFEIKSQECILYEDSTTDDFIESASGFIFGFCPKPNNNFFITYNAESIPINIPTNIKSQFWCTENSDSLCNFPIYGSGKEGITEVFFEPFVGSDGKHYCQIGDRKREGSRSSKYDDAYGYDDVYLYDDYDLRSSRAGELQVAKPCSNQGNMK